LIANDREDGTDGCGLSFWHSDLGQESSARGRNLRVDLVGGDLEERLVGFDAVAHPFQPPGDGALGDRFPELGHGDVHERLLVGVSRARRGR
jgi:hypothetical protein